jgi:hypothetical protein
MKHYPYAFLGHYDDYAIWNFKIKESHNNKYSHIILGDSRSVSGIIPDIFSDEIMNLSLTGGSIYDANCILENILNKGNQIDKITLCFAPYHFEEAGISFTERTIPFNLPNVNQFQELLKIQKVTRTDIEQYKTNSRNSLENFFWINYQLLRYKRFPFVYQITFVSNIGKLALARKNFKSITNQLNKSRGYINIGTGQLSEAKNKFAQECHRENLHINPIFELYLDKLLKICERKSIKVKLIFPPFSEYSELEINKSYEKETIRYFKNFENKYKNFNLLDDSFTYFPNYYFGDESHLNQLGAKKFTQDFLNKFNNAL